MLLLMLLKNYLKPWPAIQEKNIKFDNIQVKSAFDTSSIRNPFPGHTLSLLLVSSFLCLKAWSRSGWKQQGAEGGRFECRKNTALGPRGFSQVRPGRSEKEAALRRTLNNPEMSSSNLAK